MQESEAEAANSDIKEFLAKQHLHKIAVRGRVADTLNAYVIQQSEVIMRERIEDYPSGERITHLVNLLYDHLSDLEEFCMLFRHLTELSPEYQNMALHDALRSYQQNFRKDMQFLMLYAYLRPDHNHG